MANPYFIPATFRKCYFSPFSSFNDERYKYYNKRILTRDNERIQSLDQEKSKLNSNIMVNSGAHTLTNEKIIESPFNKTNLATVKNK